MREGIVDKLKRERETYFKDRFGLEANPFTLSPYDDIERSARVFVDRKEEIESGVVTKPTVHIMAKIAKVLNVAIEDLLKNL